MQPRACSISGVRRAAHDTKGTRQNRVAQFIAVCSSSILVETLGNAASFSSPWRGKQRVFERRKPVLMDQLQPSTNSDKLSVGVYPHCNPLRTSRGAGG